MQRKSSKTTSSAGRSGPPRQGDSSLLPPPWPPQRPILRQVGTLWFGERLLRCFGSKIGPTPASSLNTQTWALRVEGVRPNCSLNPSTSRPRATSTWVFSSVGQANGCVLPTQRWHGRSGTAPSTHRGRAGPIRCKCYGLHKGFQSSSTGPGLGLTPALETRRLASKEVHGHVPSCWHERHEVILRTADDQYLSLQYNSR